MWQVIPSHQYVRMCASHLWTVDVHQDKTGLHSQRYCAVCPSRRSGVDEKAVFMLVRLSTYTLGSSTTDSKRLNQKGKEEEKGRRWTNNRIADK